MLDNFYNVLLKSREQISRSFKLFSNQKLSTEQLEDLEEKLIETLASDLKRRGSNLQKQAAKRMADETASFVIVTP